MKDQLLAYLIAREGLDASDAVMIGDREFDARGARAVGLPTIGALWGYGKRGIARGGRRSAYRGAG